MEKNKQLKSVIDIAIKQNKKIIGLSIFRQYPDGRITNPYDIPTSEEQFKRMYDSFDTIETWDIEGKSKMLEYMLLLENEGSINHPEMKGLTLKEDFEMHLVNAKQNNREFLAFGVAIKIFSNTIYFHKVENINKAIQHFKNNYDENFVNRYIPMEKVIDFMLV